MDITNKVFINLLTSAVAFWALYSAFLAAFSAAFCAFLSAFLLGPSVKLMEKKAVRDLFSFETNKTTITILLLVVTAIILCVLVNEESQ